MARRLKRLWVSASALGNYCACQYKFLLSRQWKPIDIEEPAYFLHGKEVHKLLEGKLAVADATAPAVKAAEKLRKKAAEYGFVADEDGLELRQEIELDGAEVDSYTLKAVTLTRIIDVKGHDADGPLLVDWKTAGYPWKVVKDRQGKFVAPKASGFQPVLYLLPLVAGEEWPRRIRFFVHPKTKVQTFVYELDQGDVTNVFRMIAEIEQKWRSGKPFTKNQGWECERCPFQELCWDVDGWEDHYAETHT